METLIRIIGLALTDAINPCAFAVMTMVLISILLTNENKRHKVLLGGLAFTLAVFIGYFLYGLIIIQMFKGFIKFTTTLYPFITKGLAILAILLGVFNLKDYLYYKPGGLATEMPLRFRPRVRQILKEVTSPKGAFFAGIFVTLFLLPCTIGPYIIAGEGLSKLDIIKTIPWLLLYNIIFILPMIAITFAVYKGVSTTEDLNRWKEKNIKRIHLITGLILIAMGIAIFTGLI